MNDSKGTILVAPLIPHSWSIDFLGVSENAPPLPPKCHCNRENDDEPSTFSIFSKCPTTSIQSSSFFQIVLPDSHRFSSFSIVFIFSKKHMFENQTMTSTTQLHRPGLSSAEGSGLQGACGDLCEGSGASASGQKPCGKPRRFGGSGNQRS